MMRILIWIWLTSRALSHENNFTNNHGNNYIKYPIADGYVSSCSQKEENFGFEDFLEVRRHVPSIVSQNWASRPDKYSSQDGPEVRGERKGEYVPQQPTGFL